MIIDVRVIVYENISGSKMDSDFVRVLNGIIERMVQLDTTGDIEE